MVQNLLSMRETWVRSPDWEDPLEESIATHSKVKNPPAMQAIAGSGRSPGEGIPTPVFLGFPGGSDCKESACNAGDLGWEVPWRRAWQPTPVFLPGQSPGQRSLAGYSPRGCKESDTTEQLRTHTDTFPKSNCSPWREI